MVLALEISNSRHSLEGKYTLHVVSLDKECQEDTEIPFMNSGGHDVLSRNEEKVWGLRSWTQSWDI